MTYEQTLQALQALFGCLIEVRVMGAAFRPPLVVTATGRLKYAMPWEASEDRPELVHFDAGHVRILLSPLDFVAAGRDPRAGDMDPHRVSTDRGGARARA